jgi:hypothetical protein
MIAIILEPLIGIPGTLIGIVRNPHSDHAESGTLEPTIADSKSGQV